MFKIKALYPTELHYQFVVQNGKVLKFATEHEARDWGKKNLDGKYWYVSL